jgi:hypothetical protein
MPKQKASLILLVFAFIVGVLWIAAKDDDDSVGPSQQTEGPALFGHSRKAHRRVNAESWLSSRLTFRGSG